jgi:hypothetical protein
MSSPIKRYDVVAGRPYTARDGEEKKHWINVGRATAWDDGGISIELHAIPVGGWFDGKLNLFEQKEREQASTSRTQRPAPQRDSGGSTAGEDPDIPFRSPITRRTWSVL